MSKKKGIDEGRAKTLITAMLSLNARLQELAIDSIYDPITIETAETTTVFSGLVRRDVSNWSELLSAKKIEAGKICTLAELEDIISGKRTYKTGELSVTSLQLQGFLNLTGRVISGLGRVIPKKAETRELNETLQICKDLREHGRELIAEHPKGEPFPIVFLNVFGICGMTLWGVETRWKLNELPAQGTGVIRMPKTVNDHLLRRQGHRQPTLFEELDNEWQSAISNTKGGAEIKAGGGIIAGVELEPEENAFMDALYVMLHYQSSNTVEPKSEDYYSGGYEVAGKTALNFTATELARVYNGGKKPSGDEMARLKEVTEKLAEKRFMIEYEEEVSRGGKRPIKRSVKAYAPLFEIREETITKEGKSATLSFIVLHELLRASIASRYIELPEDIRARMRQAFGKASYTDYQLRNYLLNEVSAKRREATINRETAYERFTRPDTRPARQRELLNKALEGCKCLGLLASYEETTGKGGQLKLILNPSLDWSRKPMPILENGK